jgi:hypothetical protein
MHMSQTKDNKVVFTALGIIGLVFVASLTDHCCNLIVKTKYRAIKNHITDLIVEGRSNKNYSATSDSEDVSENYSKLSNFFSNN